jgi:carbamoyltransferase
MIIWGISAGADDAALSVIKDDQVVFASTADRFSGQLNDAHLNTGIVGYALNHGDPDYITFYEQPWHRLTRQLRAGQYHDVLHAYSVKQELEDLKVPEPRGFYYTDHQLAHASAYYHSGFDNAAVLVLDTVGQWSTASVWLGRGTKLKCHWRMGYPNSLGLFYSAMTDRCGLRANSDELAFMGLASTGDYRKYYDLVKQDLITWKRYPTPRIKLRHNLHRGCRWWRQDITDVENIAAAVQKIYEEILFDIALFARGISNTDNLVIVGDCARNSSANQLLARRELFANIYIPPAVGDAGASLGSILAHSRKPVALPNNLLGYRIEGDYPVESALELLLQGQPVAIANGSAEFGDQSLGNRSILIDPRLVDAREQINAVKGRNSWETYCPAILDEHAERFYKVSANRSPYSHFTAKAQGDHYPAVVHSDGTSKLQTIRESDNPGFYKLLSMWYQRTGCPMLLNTGLESPNQPMVNNLIQAQTWSNQHKISVLINENTRLSPEENT